ncbi:HNH endonuclease [Emticicia sp. SJ17W-69]|uniref:HNH endonuclease n=1 Tax=Emticicia sp. SJ17W-69 TaxID=3421657 RepID=UPI003EB85D5F
MRYINRLPKPQILVEKEQHWTSQFLSSTNKRPDSSKYRHPDILATLNSMSFHKCFYCEQKLKGVPSEIDHFIEVDERRELAYNWDNLYLSCTNCNNKLPNKSISVKDALDACFDADEVIEKHLYFEKECIKARGNSNIGAKTIQKYKLDTIQLDLLRSRKLTDFYNVLLKIKDLQIKQKRSSLTIDEKEKLLQFANNDSSFSLMFKLLLRKIGI